MGDYQVVAVAVVRPFSCAGVRCVEWWVVWRTDIYIFVYSMAFAVSFNTLGSGWEFGEQKV